MFGEDQVFEQDAPAEPEEAPVEPNEPITVAQSWVVIESYFAANDLVAQQINSFNNFMNNRLQVCASL
jgi:DNA-directed RNA polymerase beta subunit